MEDLICIRTGIFGRRDICLPEGNGDNEGPSLCGRVFRFDNCRLVFVYDFAAKRKYTKNHDRQKKMNKKALSPLIATILLVAFAIILGTIVMGWGKDYVAKLGNVEPSTVYEEQICEDPLVILQIRYAQGDISTQEYLQKKDVIKSSQE